VRKHRLALKNLKFAISERQLHDEYAAGAAATQRGAECLEQHKFPLEDAAAVLVSQELVTQLSLHPSSQLDVSVDSSVNTSARQSVCTHEEPLALEINELIDESPSNLVERELKQADDARIFICALRMQRLARRWLGRRALRARRLLLWRVRLIVQAAPAALRIQAVFRGHVCRVEYKKLWKWTHDPDPDHQDYTGVPACFAHSETTQRENSAGMKLSGGSAVSGACFQRRDFEPATGELVNSILRDIYKDPETKQFLVQLMLDAPLPVCSTAGRLPVHVLWKHCGDDLRVPWMQVHVAPPHMQPYIPSKMKATVLNFSSDSRIPAEDDPLLVSNPLATLAKQLCMPYESVLEAFSNGTISSFVHVVQGRGKIVRSSMGIECVQALMIDLCMIRALLSCAHTSLEAFRYLRNTQLPLSHWQSGEDFYQLFLNRSDSWLWITSNSPVFDWCLCKDDDSIKQRTSRGQTGFAAVADCLMKRCKDCLDMCLFFLRNSSNQFPPSCCWVRAWHFSLRGLWYLTGGKQLSALQQLQESFVELVCSHMRHVSLILLPSVHSRSMSTQARDLLTRKKSAVKDAMGLSERCTSASMRPQSAVSAIRQPQMTNAQLIEPRSSCRPFSAASSFM
jgi:hypothetical protein